MAEWINSLKRLPEQGVWVLGKMKDNPFSPIRQKEVRWIGNGWETRQHFYVSVYYWKPLEVYNEQ